MLQLLLAATLFFAPQTTEPASDFAIRFDHKGCHYEYLDTFEGTYSHIGAEAPVSFTLSNEQRRRLFDAVMAAQFFDLPAMISGRSKSSSYELDVRNAGRQHRVSWTAGSDWVRSQTGRPFLELQGTIFDILKTHPDVLRLPRRGDGCRGGPPQVR